jgi:mono/diheme cytochrome c family protein
MMLPLNWWSSGETSGHSFPAQGVACALALIFLVSCSPSAPGPSASSGASAQPLPEEVLSQGQAIYEQLCATCHFDGHGSDKAPSLADSAIVKNSPDKMITQILHGSQGVFKNRDGKEVKNIMPAQNSLSNDDIAAVITYVRHQFGKVDQLTTPAEVAAQR